VTSVPGVAGERTRQLEKLGIRTVGDLLLHRPRRYEDRRRVLKVRELELGQAAIVRGKIVAAGTHTFRRGSRSMFEFILDDGTARLHCRWWNLPFIARFFAVGDDVVVYGKPNSLRPRTIDHPETEKLEAEDDVSLHLNRIVPIHPATEGLSTRTLRGLMGRALELFGAAVPDEFPGLIPVGVEPGGWPARPAALQALHFPEELGDAERARQRLALDEFVALQFEIQRRRRNLERNAVALPCGGDNRWIRPFLAGLGFRLTEAQARVLREIRADLSGRVPMRRLLQGDVGSGKTVVAACSALMTLESGWNVAVMAPTEILAGQLAANFQRWFAPLGIVVELRTGTSRPGAATPGLLPRVTVGTHALIQQEAQMDRLGLVVIDEQHKFGVAQREALVRKGRYPHLLVMTATPIPRTLALTLYGDLDVSVVDQPPAGRGRIRTHLRAPGALPRVWAFVRRELEAGRQAYVVCARVEESEHDELRAVTREAEAVRAELAPHAVGVLHGQLPAEEKESVMAGFRSGATKVLVATTVVEVGVDVPNATVMVVLDAGQFGLAQLHQLRGRVGRAGHESHCILVADQRTDTARERLQVMASTTDGFELAEADLRLRGAGELIGRAQSGLPALRFGDLQADRALVELARGWVKSALAR
jgi:ATP-dependent DNA helicase RecG